MGTSPWLVGNEIDRSGFGNGCGFGFERLEGGVDGGDGALIDMAIGGGGDVATGDEGPNRWDVIKACDQDGVGFPAGLNGRSSAQGHGVIGAKDGLHFGLLSEESMGGGVRLLLIVVGVDEGDDLHLGIAQGGLEAGPALLTDEI